MADVLLGVLKKFDTYSGSISAVIAILTLVVSFALWWFRRNRPLAETPLGTGGHGGSASTGSGGFAVGGNGGQGGVLGSGGNGGNASVEGDGVAIGGSGGDAGVPWRPALGAASVLEQKHHRQQVFSFPEGRDIFGFWAVGAGGHGGHLGTVVHVNGYYYPLIPLMQFVRFWSPNSITLADATRPKDSQCFWEEVRRVDEATATAAEQHVRYCLDVSSPNRIPPPDPYQRSQKQ
ncbi:hypothetical protein J2858_003331 [Neorhizobium galegae]|nr:hypothetical protein [Neorhizobium galegae]